MVQAALPRIADEDGAVLALLAQALSDRAIPATLIAGLRELSTAYLKVGFVLAFTDETVKGALRRAIENKDTARDFHVEATQIETPPM